MGTLAQAKTYGGVGSILLLLSVVPSVGFALGIAGFVLILVAVKYISQNVGDPSIFDNMVYFVVVGLVGFLIAFFLVFAAIFPFLGAGLPTPETPVDLLDPATLAASVTILIGLAIGWILLVVAAVFLRRSFSSIAGRLGVSMFATAALLYFIGAILLIVLIGLLLIFIAEILMVVAFFSIPEQLPAPGIGQPPTIP
ncbi:MAG: DUF996 domain-containing protein [Thermoplasmata archaeon]